MKRERIIKSGASGAGPYTDRLALVTVIRPGDEQARHVTQPPAKETQISESLEAEVLKERVTAA